MLQSHNGSSEVVPNVVYTVATDPIAVRALVTSAVMQLGALKCLKRQFVPFFSGPNKVGAGVTNAVLQIGALKWLQRWFVPLLLALMQRDLE